MKKIVLSIIVVLFLVSASFGQSLIGARAAGMGGAGVAVSRDMSCAYYNPAALMRTGTAGFLASAGVAYSGIDKLMTAASQSNDPAKFAMDNYSSDINVNANINGIIGGSINKVGLSVLPLLGANLQKPASSLAIDGAAMAGYTGALTVGKTFGFGAFPAIDIGANLKYIGGTSGSINVFTNPITGASSGSQNISNLSGFGLDLGALATFDVPMVTSVSVGLVARDLAETINATIQPSTLSAPTGSTTLTETKGAEQKTSQTVDPTYVLGAAGTIPVIGATVAADIESGNGFSNTHFGFEYPVLLNLFTLRAGLASGTNLSLTTVGAKVAIPFLALNLAYVMDSKNSNNNQIVIDLAGGF